MILLIEVKKIMKLLNFLVHGPQDAAHRALLRRLICHSHSAYRAYEIGIALLFSVQSVKHLVIELGVVLLDGIGVGEGPLCIFYALGLSRLDHLGIHLLELVGLPDDGLPQVLFCGFNSLHGTQMVGGVNRLSLGRGAK
jgi:hypothetical protein